jgi:hypothetical protein
MSRGIDECEKIPCMDKVAAQLYYQAKQRSREKGWVFSLKKSDIRVPKFCPVLGIPLFVGNGRPGPNSPTLDRINNNLPYTASNIMVISFRANELKRDATIDELQSIINYILAFSHLRPSIDYDPPLPLEFIRADHLPQSEESQQGMVRPLPRPSV